MTSRLKPIHFSDFSGGLVTDIPANELDNTQSPDLDNIVLMDRGFKKRQGDSAFCSAMNSGANIQGIGFYQPSSAVKYLMAIAGAKIYKSDALDGTMDDITGAVSITANQNNIWTHSVLNDLSIFVGGAPDAPIKWNASGNAAALGGSPVSGSFGFTSRDRMYIGSPTANQSTLYWSILSNPEDWSGTGSGNVTIETNDGDRLIGGIPLNNDVLLLFKRYSIHQAITTPAISSVKPLVKGVGCCGKLAMTNVNGLVYFISMEPRLYVTDGYTVSLVDTAGKVNTLFDGINKSRLAYINMIHDKVRNLVVIYCSYGSATTNNYAIVWDLERKCWLRFTTGQLANVSCIVDGYRHFVGAYDGIIYERDKSGIYVDASNSSAAINSYYYTAWLKGSSNDTVIDPFSATVNFQTQTSGTIGYAYGFNYNKDTKAGDFTEIAQGGKWDIDTWDDSFIWGGQTDYQKSIYVYGRGNNFQFKLQNNTLNENMSINSISFMMKEQGTKELNNV